jgi:hypothetical protein
MTTESKSATAVLEGKELHAAINEVVSRHLDRQCFSVFLFGSESTGTAEMSLCRAELWSGSERVWRN